MSFYQIVMLNRLNNIISISIQKILIIISTG